ncbi:hypothetical protein CKAH01_02958 [Colletotrichum kahawae]|uniref:Uncharacterized protein n=1 Tax=Colletotrichum kahawae TaxID=34407 RepID=A0AAD9YU81_COLKA|nr:hypothetical protein CKAH01_02958 [Colletotrichum kahawae]
MATRDNDPSAATAETPARIAVCSSHHPNTAQRERRPLSNSLGKATLSILGPRLSLRDGDAAWRLGPGVVGWPVNFRDVIFTLKTQKEPHSINNQDVAPPPPVLGGEQLKSNRPRSQNIETLFTAWGPNNTCNAQTSSKQVVWLLLLLQIQASTSPKFRPPLREQLRRQHTHGATSSKSSSHPLSTPVLEISVPNTNASPAGSQSRPSLASERKEAPTAEPDYAPRVPSSHFPNSGCIQAELSHADGSV